MNVGEFLLIAGCSIIIAAGITAWRFRPKPRVSGWSAEDVELLTMPAHERVARQLCCFHGQPEWRRYTALAVATILQRKP
ncbi:hypothetical protein NK6_8799 [Bradyrhizobium diazoefficiens]|uniref:Uncharacterized protein n=1 Tax=Bradyrhizobium diazoefficiens TaxID=1355477 RepID=A0A0E4BVE2_9BRAD|nr:hypothetical protein NK6_8799 [Bradyrhizobium diazoefficiens]